jgi:hypothetical protein
MFLDRWLTKNRATALIVAVLGGGAVWAAVAVGARVSHRLTPDRPTSAAAPTYPTNPNGQTYGSAAGIPWSQAPDLVQATGASAKGQVTGYIRKSELDAASGADVNSPQAAVAWTQAHAGKTTTIPLYTQDGKTVIGKFTIAPPAPTSTQQPSP